MSLVEVLTVDQKNQLIEIREEYLEYIKKRGENKFLRDRINAIEEELLPKEKSMPIKSFD